MEIFKTHNPVEAMNYAKECLVDGHEGMDVFYNDTLFLQTGVLNTSNIERAKELGIPVWSAEHLGGSILCFPGDLSLCMTSWGDNKFGEDLMQLTVDYLKERNLNVTTDKNDILLDGKKVASWARATTINGWCQTVAHFSVNVDVDLIRQICSKPMEKIPGALSEYGITAEDILPIIVDIINKI